MEKNKTKLILLAIIGIALLAFFLHNPYTYKYQPEKTPSTFEKFFEAKIQNSKQNKVHAGNEERFVRMLPGKSKFAILFIHGFGASRAEGEMVVEKITQKYKANTYYLRLPGHGITKKEHAKVTFEDYMNSVEQAFAAMQLIGEKTILIGSSTGGTLATWLASRYPDKIHALILSSPFYDFYDPTSKILDIPGGMALGKLVMGEDRNADNLSPRKQKGYNKYWLIDQKYDALKALNDIQNFVNRDEIYRRITTPSLLFYYFKNEDQKDTTVSIETMLEAMHKFGTLRTPDGKTHASPLNRSIAVADGNHILMSKYVKTDKELVLREIFSFMDDLVIKK